MAAVDRAVDIASGTAEGHRIDARDDIAGGGNRVDGFLALRQVAGVAGQLDDIAQCCRMHGDGNEVARFAVDEIVGLHAAFDGSKCADAALQFADDEGQDHVALQFDARLEQRLHRAEIGGIAGLHVGNADTVDELVVDETGIGVDGPALGDRIGIEMAVEQQALAAALAFQATDRVEPPTVVEGLQLGFDADLCKLSRHPARQNLLALGFRMALVLDHLRQKIEAGLFVDPIHEGLRVHCHAP